MRSVIGVGTMVVRGVFFSYLGEGNEWSVMQAYVLSRPLPPLWVEGAGHNDVELHAEYLQRLKELVRTL
jgi:hypothetical protein